MFLTKLDLSNERIDDAGAKELGLALRRNCTLTTLDLSDNYITNDGAKIFAENLAVNKTLLSLNLRKNPIGYDGIQPLADNYSLIKLEADYISIAHIVNSRLRGDERPRLLSYEINDHITNNQCRWERRFKQWFIVTAVLLA